MRGQTHATSERPTVGRCLFVLLCAAFAIVACRKPPSAAAPADDLEPETRLHVAARTELFVEIPPLVAGQPSRLAIHFTRLDGWKPVAAGRVVVELGADTVTSDPPSSPGIFAATLTPPSAGERSLAITLDLDGVQERHDLGSIRVHATEAEARADRHATHAPVAIKFLMEQQWHTEFAVAPASERALRASMPVFGVLRGRPDADALVRAPLPGQITKSGVSFPRLGDVVKPGQVLAFLTPRFDATLDVGALARDRARAAATLLYATRERERMERLAKEGLASDRDAEGAKRDEAIARSEVEAAKRSMAGLGSPGSAGSLPLTAPIAGVLLSIDTAPAAIAERGAALFRVTDVDRLWVELRVPEAELAHAAAASGVSFEIENKTFALDGKALVAIGKAVDPVSRTAPIVFDFDNHEVHVAVGTALRARLYTEAATVAVAVPIAAVVDDDGQNVVYVQVDGEAFERRAITVGARDAGFVGVTSGLIAGDRVVVRGAYALKLASSSSSLPAHGHVH